MMRLAKCAAAASALLASTFFATSAAAQDETDPPAEFELSANVGLVSDYRFRGLSLSGKDPAVQGGIDLAHKSGFFVGTWASSIADNGGDNLELDLYGGYAGSAGGLDYSATVLYYVYPGASGLNYWELKGTAGTTIGPAALEAQVAWVPDQDSFPGDNVYLGVSADVGIPNTPFGLRAAVGRETGGYDGKWDWELGANYTWQQLTASVAYVDTNYGGVNEAGRNGKAGVVFSLVANF